MRLSKNLTLKEVVKSRAATSKKISNKPNLDQVRSLELIAKNVFQKVRDHFGVPIYISSGFRSSALNAVIGGSSTSQHCKGEALDLDADVFGGVENHEIFNYIKDNLEFDQLIWEYGNDKNPAWVHVSYKSSGNRNKILILA